MNDLVVVLYIPREKTVILINLNFYSEWSKGFFLLTFNKL